MAQTIDIFRSSTSGWLRGTLAGWGTALLFLAGPVGAVLASGTTETVNPAWPLILTAVALVIIGLRWVEDRSTKYELTADRLILHRGLINKSIDEVELYRVKDVRIDFSLINQMADIGTLTLTTSDETTRAQPLVMRDVHRARARREELRTRVEAARRRRGVREFDMVDDAAY
ncbi:PH domain-containing protein [uncultured Sphingomonas sp.]|uniref:PH domain-containing protein n=1 Tax=uncultured Sphingomonas sp. TaxID=158754 RepID=UPI0037479E82